MCGEAGTTKGDEGATRCKTNIHIWLVRIFLNKTIRKMMQHTFLKMLTLLLNFFWGDFILLFAIRILNHLDMRILIMYGKIAKK